MTKTYQVLGMTCTSCESQVAIALQNIEHVTAVEVSKDKKLATIAMSKHVALSELRQVLDKKYQLLELSSDQKESTESWFSTYKPVLLIFIYLTITATIIELSSADVDMIRAMRNFMAGFFLTFSFFKMLNIEGFKNSYSMYDIIAQRFPAWSYAYVFIELSLGVAFLVDFNPIITNSITLILMLVSIIGVLKSVINKQKIQCACLGDVFNLPMSTITIIEDGLMILMSLAMLVIQLA